MKIEPSKALELVQSITDKAIQGVGPLSNATELANQYLSDPTHKSLNAKIDALIKWESAKNFTSGFVTSLGGIITLPVVVPVAIGASWIIQARLVAAIAKIYGHDLKSEKVRTMVLLSLVGGGIEEVLKEVSVEFATKLSMAALNQIPGRMLIEINKQVGFRLFTKAGSTGVINFIKIIPVAGGLVAGGVDLYFCRRAGFSAKKIFKSGQIKQQTKAA